MLFPFFIPGPTSRLTTWTNVSLVRRPVWPREQMYPWSDVPSDHVNKCIPGPTSRLTTWTNVSLVWRPVWPREQMFNNQFSNRASGRRGDNTLVTRLYGCEQILLWNKNYPPLSAESLSRIIFEAYGGGPLSFFSFKSLDCEDPAGQ